MKSLKTILRYLVQWFKNRTNIKDARDEADYYKRLYNKWRHDAWQAKVYLHHALEFPNDSDIWITKAMNQLYDPASDPENSPLKMWEYLLKK